LLIELSEKLQFTYDVYEVEDKAWGGKDKDGNWNGLIRDILTLKADLAMTSLKITTERSEIIDFSIPFMETGIAIVVSLRPGAISTTAFLSNYSNKIFLGFFTFRSFVNKSSFISRAIRLFDLDHAALGYFTLGGHFGLLIRVDNHEIQIQTK
jgi:hypothetical protein